MACHFVLGWEKAGTPSPSAEMESRRERWSPGEIEMESRWNLFLVLRHHLNFSIMLLPGDQEKTQPV